MKLIYTFLIPRFRHPKAVLERFSLGQPRRILCFWDRDLVNPSLLTR